MVNRVWQRHFGQAHRRQPEQLRRDRARSRRTRSCSTGWPAEFVERRLVGRRRLHRLILTSEAYRRASRHPDPKAVAAKDPTGTSYAVFQPRRLAAEELRDAMLAVVRRAEPRDRRHPGPAGDQPGGRAAAAAGHGHVRPGLAAVAAARAAAPAVDLRAQAPRPARPVPGGVQPARPGDRRASAATPRPSRRRCSACSTARRRHDRALALAARVLERDRRRTTAAIDRAFRLAFGRSPTTPRSAACLRALGRR